MDNAKYKTIQSCEKLEKYLRLNPLMFLYDLWPERRNRYVLRKSREHISGVSVDGRSVRAIYYKLVCRTEDRGMQL